MTTHIVKVLSISSATLLGHTLVHSGEDLTIQNLDTVYSVYIGGTESVTSSSFGYRLPPEEAVSFALTGKDELWAIAGGEASPGSTKVSTMSTGLES